MRPRARAATVRFSEHENARSSPLRKNSAHSGRSSVFFANFSLRLVEPSAPGSLLAARSGRSDSRTRLPIHSAPCGTGRRTQRRHTRGAGSRDGGGQTGRGRARRRGRGGCAERTRRVHRAELHERRAREGCDRGASRETAPNASARSRRAIGVSPRRRASSAREIRLSIWNSTRNSARRTNDSLPRSRRSIFATFDFRDVRSSRRRGTTRV